MRNDMSQNSFIILHYFVISFIHEGITTTSYEIGKCTNRKTNERECCFNYYQEKGICKVCPKGRFGENCTEQCPQNQYGELCRGICNCTSDETCDPVEGCLPKRVCTRDNGEFKCCMNYYQYVKNKCTVCFPGTYGQNCKENCPNGTYGYLCRQKCNCNINVSCDKRYGCVDQECPPGTFGDNCTEECPLGFYGNFCVGKCTCDDYCDKQYGCVKTTRETGTLYSSDIQSQPQQITGKSALPYCQENTSSLPFFPTIFYLLLAVSVEAIVICILIGTTIYFARSREKSWNLYSCPLPANTIALETAQEDDYTLLTNRIQLPRCEMNRR